MNSKEKKVLTCGKLANSTQYDHLRGIANRNEHAHIPEPEVAMIFRKKGGKNAEVDMNELEERLWKAKKEVWSEVLKSSKFHITTCMSKAIMAIYILQSDINEDLFNPIKPYTCSFKLV